MEPLEKARAAAVRLLQVRPRTEAELRQRLARKGFEAQVQEAVLEEFKRKGLIDDAKFARYYVTQAILSKPVGRRALLYKMKTLGIDGQVALQAVDSGTQEQDELETAKRLAAQRLERLKGLEGPVLQRRLFGFLSRRGFSSEVARKVTREVTSEDGHPRASEDQEGFPPSRE